MTKRRKQKLPAWFYVIWILIPVIGAGAWYVSERKSKPETNVTTVPVADAAKVETPVERSTSQQEYTVSETNPAAKAEPVEWSGEASYTVNVPSNQLTGKVIGVIDGDTIDILNADNETIRIRFNGIDCPEKGQPFGNNATDFVKETIAGKMVRVVETDEPDRYGRTIGNVYLPVSDPLVNLPDKFINRALVKAGLAWHYKEYSDDERLARDEIDARRKKSGLWAGSHKVFAPWDWRKLSKAERDEHR